MVPDEDNNTLLSPRWWWLLLPVALVVVGVASSLPLHFSPPLLLALKLKLAQR